MEQNYKGSDSTISHKNTWTDTISCFEMVGIFCLIHKKEKFEYKRTDNAMAKRKMTKVQLTIYNIQKTKDQSTYKPH